METAPPTVLVLDDEQDVRSLVQLVLAREGWRVFATADGREALRVLGGERVDVALVDLLMPGMSGRQFLAEVRRLERPRQPAVLVVSALSADAVVRELGEPAEGGYTLVAKPFELAELREVVARAAAARAVPAE